MGFTGFFILHFYIIQRNLKKSNLYYTINFVFVKLRFSNFTTQPNKIPEDDESRKSFFQHNTGWRVSQLTLYKLYVNM